MTIPPPRAVLDPAAVRLEREFKHARPLVGCRFDPSGRFLFVSSEDDSVQRYDLLTGTKTALVGHTSWVRGMTFVAPGPGVAPDFAAWRQRKDALQSVVGPAAVALPAPKAAPFTLVSGDYHGKLLWWPGEADAPKPARTVQAHDGWVRAVAVSPDGKTLASCGNDHAVRLWNAADGSAIRTLEGHDSHVYNLAFHPDGTRLISCDLKGVVKDWDLKTGRCERDLDAKVLTKYDPTFMADIGGARGMAFSPDGSAFAVCGITNVSNAFAGVGNPLVLHFDWKVGKAKPLMPKQPFQGTMWGVAFYPGGGIIAAGGAGGQGRVWFWKGDDPQSAHTLSTPANARDFTLAPDASLFAVAGSNGTASVYNFAGGPTPPPPTPKKK